MRGTSGLLLSALALLAAACGSEAPRKTYYERQIEPILMGSCSGNTGGCHVADPDDPFSFAAGNFDVSSFETVQLRRDVLERFGAYEVPLLLIKAVGNTGELGVTYDGTFRPLEIEHAGGGIFQVGSDSYLTLLEWTNNGATENGLPPEIGAATGTGPCSTSVPEDFDDTGIADDPNFAEFETAVQPLLASCNAGNCHGAPQSAFYITCGDDDRQLAYNFEKVRAFVDDPVDNSPVLQLPLAVEAGGLVHTGGDHFESRDDPSYRAIATWAEKVGRVDFGAGDPGRAFFADHVQPLLLTRGCSFAACHSPQAANDFQLRSGSQGFFSAVALERNYAELRADFMAFEVPDARRSRAVAKGILARFGGINHRGGPVLETPGSGGSMPSTCADPFDPEAASAYCIVQRWVDIEREQLLAAGEVFPLGEGDTVNLVYVEREATHVASPLEFDTYQPGSDLLVAPATIGADGHIASVGEATSLLAGCPGAADLGAVDVSAPDVAPNGTTVVFSMRTAAGEGRQIYTVETDGSACTRVTTPEPETGGILVHNFDPAFTPDGAWIVYASTRGGEGDSPTPTRSRKLFLPQSDIWRMRPDGSEREQLTYLTNSELSPQFMREGRVIMTTEKVSEGFYQLSGRRMNWDRTDYHPLLAQRAESPFADPADPSATAPSVGYQQATEIREGFDGNFLAVFSDAGTRAGAGTLAIFNRSVGAFELGRDDPGFLEAVVFPDRAATGRAGAATDGAYRSPFPLPGGRILASYAAYQGDLATATSLDFDLVAVDPRTGDRTPLVTGPGAQVEAVLALRYPERELYDNHRQLVFGGGVDLAQSGGEDFGVMHFPDARLIFTLLNSNLRRGRPVELYEGATHLAFYEEHPAPASQTAPNAGDIYEERTLLGRVPLREDGSAKVRVPVGMGVILELQDEGGAAVVTMREEHQVGPGEYITFGVATELFDAVCGGCHGSVSGNELEVTVTPDALTGASQSLSLDAPPVEPN